MSLKAWGIFKLTGNEPLTSQINFAFQSTIIAAQNGIMVKFGGNVWPEILKQYSNVPDCLVYELVDDPLDTDAETLFIGDGVKLFVNDNRQDTGEKLSARMSRIKTFLEEVIQLPIVVGIELNINTSALADSEPVKIEINEFVSTMLEKYQENSNWTPGIRLIISKSE